MSVLAQKAGEVITWLMVGGGGVGIAQFVRSRLKEKNEAINVSLVGSEKSLEIMLKTLATTERQRDEYEQDSKDARAEATQARAEAQIAYAAEATVRKGLAAAHVREQTLYDALQESKRLLEEAVEKAKLPPAV